MPYTQPTLTQAQTALSLRLFDPLFVHWTTTELTGYLREALRWWNVSTDHFRDSGTINLVMGTTFFDLPTELSALCGYSVTNWELVTDLQFALLEPPAAGGTWTGTAQYDLVQLNAAIQRRRDQFLRETGAVLTPATTALTANATGRFELAENIINIRHAEWTVNATALKLPLLRTDEWAGNNFRPTWVAPNSQPRWYSVTVTPPLFIQIMPPPLTNGVLGHVTINSGVALNPLVSSLLRVPDDWAWVIKWGALADLLQGDGLQLDPQRAEYCEARWRQGVQQAAKDPALLTARINGAVVSIASLADADKFSPLWSLLPGIPHKIVHAGQNLIAPWPPAGGGGPYTATVDVVRNAPIPLLGTDILQLSQDVYDTILDYAQHLALFKEGPGQLELSMALLNRATVAAGVDLQLQQAAQPSRRLLLQQTNQDEHAQPRQEEAIPVE